MRIYCARFGMVVLALVAAIGSTAATAQNAVAKPAASKTATQIDANGRVVVPSLNRRHIVDQSDKLSSDELTRLNRRLREFTDATGAQMVVVLLSTLGDEDIADFGPRAGRIYGIGQRSIDDGVLLTLAPEERKMRIDVGYGLEYALTDAMSRRITGSMKDDLRAERYAAAIELAINSVERTIGTSQARAELEQKRQAEERRHAEERSALLKDVAMGGAGLAAVGGVAGVFLVRRSRRRRREEEERDRNLAAAAKAERERQEANQRAERAKRKRELAERLAAMTPEERAAYDREQQRLAEIAEAARKERLKEAQKREREAELKRLQERDREQRRREKEAAAIDSTPIYTPSYTPSPSPSSSDDYSGGGGSFGGGGSSDSW